MGVIDECKTTECITDECLGLVHLKYPQQHPAYVCQQTFASKFISFLNQASCVVTARQEDGVFVATHIRVKIHFYHVKNNI